MINENVISYDMSPTPDHGLQFLGSKVMGNNENVLWCTQPAKVHQSRVLNFHDIHDIYTPSLYSLTHKHKNLKHVSPPLSQCLCAH